MLLCMCSLIEYLIQGGNEMRKIKTKHDMNIPGWGVIPSGTAFKVEKFNKRFVYVLVKDGVTLRLARKADCEVMY